MRFFVPQQWQDADRPLRVVLVGAGGNGSEVLDGLARMHFGLQALDHPGLHVTVFDGDEVSRANIGRQRFAPGDVGTNKAIALVNRFNLFFGLGWDAIPAHLEQESVEKVARQIDLLITCVDRADVRAMIGKVGEKVRAAFGNPFMPLWLDMGNDRVDGQAILGHFAGKAYSDSLRLPNVYDLYPELAEIDDSKGGPSCSLAEAIAEQDLWVNKYASMSLGMIWTLLTQGFLDHHGMTFNSAEGSMNPMKIDPAAWAFMGYHDDSLNDSEDAA